MDNSKNNNIDCNFFAEEGETSRLIDSTLLAKDIPEFSIITKIGISNRFMPLENKKPTPRSHFLHYNR